ncbi:S-adenosyl-L-methionine-dependent methyltransferases superfamily protein [Tanacetum coccineum]
MVSARLASLSCNYDLLSSVYAKNTLKVLCIRHSGGSFPLFLAFKIPGVMVDIVETDLVVISTSTRAMVVQERLHLYESDVEQFITDRTDICDMVFVDAYDGDDVFPYKPWDPDSIFLKELGEWLHPDHGPVVVNLHSDMDIVDGD